MRRDRLRCGVLLLLMLLLSSPAAASSTSAHANPFAYAAEYRDPTWGGYYLRRRWYDPRVPGFLSRDPLAALNRYGYAGGNPLARVDPDGQSYRAFGRGLARLNGGIGGHFARFFLGQMLVPLQIIAAPAAFWHQLAHNTAGMPEFLAAGVLVELGSYGAMYSSAARTLTISTGRRLFGARAGLESVLGVGQSIAASVQHSHFHGAALLQGLETILGPEAVYRVGAGIGYQPFNLDTADVDHLVRQHAGRGEALLFRVRSKETFGYAGGYRNGMGWTTPWMERAQIGLYHERLVAISQETVYVADLLPVRMTAEDYRAGWVDDLGRSAANPGQNHYFEYIGKSSVRRVDDRFRNGNPRNLYTADDFYAEESARIGLSSANVPARNNYDLLNNNCHHHLNGMLTLLGQR